MYFVIDLSDEFPLTNGEPKPEVPFEDEVVKQDLPPVPSRPAPQRPTAARESQEVPSVSDQENEKVFQFN